MNVDDGRIMRSSPKTDVILSILYYNFVLPARVAHIYGYWLQFQVLDPYSCLEHFWVVDKGHALHKGVVCS